MAPFIILMVLLSWTIIISGHDVEDSCKGPTPNYTYQKHLLANQELGCCRLINCNKGTYAVPCSRNNEDSTSCRDCEADTYMGNDDVPSTKNLKCSKKTVCELPAMITKDEGDKQENRLCGCNIVDGYWNANPLRNPYHPTDCSGPKSCDSGMELHPKGDCGACPWGEYKSSSRDHRCIAWTKCRYGEEVIENGTTTTDARCGIRTTPRTTTDIYFNTGSAQQSSLEAAHIAGITIGVIIFVAALVGLIIGVILYRRKKQRTPEKGELDETGNLRRPPPPEDDDEEINVEKGSVIYRPVLPNRAGIMADGHLRGKPV